MLIGLGGGAASSMTAGVNAEDLDFASVQRGQPGNPAACAGSHDRCWQMGKDKPDSFRT
jgi:phosphoribosylformylglycinamidine synthase